MVKMGVDKKQKKTTQNKMTKAYTVQCHSGSFDSYVTWIAGIFDSLEKAEEAKNFLNKRAKDIKENCPVNPYNDLTDEEEAIYWEYHRRHEKEMEWTEAEVKEYIVNNVFIPNN